MSSAAGTVSVPITQSTRTVLARDARDRGVTVAALAAAILEDYARNNATLATRFLEARRIVEERLRREAAHG